MKSSVTVSPVDLDADWDEYFRTYWTSWKHPLQATGQLTFAHIGTDTALEAASYEQTKAAYLAAARANRETQKWLKAVERGRIVGGGAWTVHRSDQAYPVVDASWVPGPGFEKGGEVVDLSGQFYAQLWRWREKLMSPREHIYGQAFWILPSARHGDAAPLMMARFISAIQDAGVEAYAEGTLFSTPLLVRAGFVVIAHPTMVFTREEPSERWRKLVEELQARPTCILWRPRGGAYEEGRTVLPWEGRARGKL